MPVRQLERRLVSRSVDWSGQFHASSLDDLAHSQLPITEYKACVKLLARNEQGRRQWDSVPSKMLGGGDGDAYVLQKFKKYLIK